ncbi:MAG TPA: hypothetical protein VFV87_02340 [Pirellulaceae bacterium]|nr:hypothetical protein [Pirellulaceae bacterium]
MRRFILGTLLSLALFANVGCFLPIYSGDPAIRTQELLFTSEDFRNVLEEWRRIWFVDQPSHMTVMRTHGGVL